MTKYTLVKSYYGLGGDLCVMLGGLSYARKTNRKLIVDWDGGLYGSKSENGGLFNYLFKSPIACDILSLPKLRISVFPDYWRDHIFSPPLTYISGLPLTLSRPEDVPSQCLSDCVVITRDSADLRNKKESYYSLAAELVPNEEIQKVVSEVESSFADFKKTIGIHFRHGNGEKKVIPPDPLWFRNKINQYLREQNLNSDDILLLISSDCSAVIEYFRKYYANCISTPKEYIENGGGALHIKRNDLTNDEKVGLAKEALIDMYCLAKVDYFIGSGGFFSRFVNLLRSGARSISYSGNRTFDDYKFDKNYYEASGDAELEGYLKQKDHPLDGVFVRVKSEEKIVFYYDKIISTLVVGEKINSQQGLELRKNLVKLRLY